MNVNYGEGAVVLAVLVICLQRWGYWVLLSTHEFNVGNSKDLAFMISSCVCVCVCNCFRSGGIEGKEYKERVEPISFHHQREEEREEQKKRHEKRRISVRANRRSKEEEVRQPLHSYQNLEPA